MGFWKFLCSFAAFKALHDLFSNKPQNRPANNSQDNYVDYDFTDYTPYGSAGRYNTTNYRHEIDYERYDIDDSHDEICEIESDDFPYDDYDY